jgi:hypothetical protein
MAQFGKTVASECVEITTPVRYGQRPGYGTEQETKHCFSFTWTIDVRRPDILSETAIFCLGFIPEMCPDDTHRSAYNARRKATKSAFS